MHLLRKTQQPAGSICQGVLKVQGSGLGAILSSHDNHRNCKKHKIAVGNEILSISVAL